MKLMTTSDEALGFLLTQTTELPLQDGRPNLLSLLFTHSLLPASVIKTLAAEMYNLRNLWKKRGGGCKNSHSESFFQQNLQAPPVQELLHSLFYLLSYIKEQKQSRKGNKEEKKNQKTAYLKVTTIIQYIIILLDIFFTAHIYTIGQFSFLKDP